MTCVRGLSSTWHGSPGAMMSAPCAAFLPPGAMPWCSVSWSRWRKPSWIMWSRCTTNSSPSSGAKRATSMKNGSGPSAGASARASPPSLRRGSACSTPIVLPTPPWARCFARPLMPRPSSRRSRTVRRINAWKTGATSTPSTPGTPLSGATSRPFIHSPSWGNRGPRPYRRASSW